MVSGARRRTYGLLLAGVAVLSAGIALVLYGTSVMHGLELSTVDTRFSIRSEQKPRDDIVLVQIDDVTFQELNIRFPFPRSLHGKVIDAVDRDGPKAVAYDIEFLEPTKPQEDNALINAVARAGPDKVILADTQPNEQGESGVFGGQGVLDRIGARAGNTQVGEDSDGVLRRIPLEVGGLKTFPVVTAEAVLGKEITQADMGGDKAWIDFAGPPGTYPAVSFSKVLNGEVDPGLFAGKIVVIGASDPSLKDITPTAAGGEPMPGPEAEANAIATALEGFPLQSTPLGIDLLLITLMGFVTPLASFRLSALRALALGVGVGALYLLLAQLVFVHDLIVPVVYPMTALALSIVGSLAVQYILETLERQRVRQTFARFVPEQVVGDVLARTDEDLRLGAEETECTVLFSDIRGFTTFSEGREPRPVVEILNHYLEEMSDAIFGHGGTITSYIGDGIMAVFGAPLPQQDHAERALAAAQEMLEVRLPRFNEWLAESGVEEEFRIGVGLNSGVVVHGNIGSDDRLNYTAIGDTVNTAARLEGMTKGTEHQIFLSDSTYSQLRDQDGIVFVDEMSVRGRKAAMKVWSPGGGASAAG